MAQKSGGIIHTLTKPPLDSSMTYDESENLYFWVSKLEYLIKGSMRMVNLINLEINMEERMGHRENKVQLIDNNIERIVKLIQNLEEKLPKVDDVARGT